MLEANSKSNERLSSRVDKHMYELHERIGKVPLRSS